MSADPVTPRERAIEALREYDLAYFSHTCAEDVAGAVLAALREDAVDEVALLIADYVQGLGHGPAPRTDRVAAEVIVRRLLGADPTPTTEET